ncbi:unnamed protein product [Larinioides sclopetarius]|uniref:Uncharacterized protein n=1 Tax=Larinioides sclopetarius TaxID=280406 RepID=A0AAV1YZZ7_9ARAC
MTPISKDLDSIEDKDTLIQKTFELLKSGGKETQLDHQYKKVILILGDTGNGKTKFTQWVTGDNTELIAKETEEDTGEYIIEDINGTGYSTITSETVYPQLVVDNETNVPYYDCPGFNDTRDSSNEIATTYFIKKIVDHAESVKLIFVINYPSMRKGVDRYNFMNLVKHAADFIRNFEKFRNSTAIVVTKVDNLYVKQGNSFHLVDNDKIIAAVANFLIEIRQDLEGKLRDGFAKEKHFYEAAVKFISILLTKDEEQYARIGIFRRPDQPGPLSEISLLQEGKAHIKRLINKKLTFSEKKYDVFGYTISEKCKLDIHYLVEEINRTFWISLCRLKEEIKEHYYNLVKTIQRTVKSFVTATSFCADLYEAKELSTRLRDGYSRIISLEKDVLNVTSPEDLARIINAVISDLGIDISKNDILEIEMQVKYFKFLQVLSDRKLNMRPCDELFRDISMYLSNAKQNLREDIDDVEPAICKQIESDFQQISKSLQDQIDEKTKLLDVKEALEVLVHYHDAVLKMVGKTENATSIADILKIVRDVTRDININLPKHNALNAIKREKNFLFLKSIDGTKVNFMPSTWTYPFQSVVKHINESKMWYRFLDDLYYKFSEYEIQKNREKLNVAEIEDWGNTDKPQGIIVTKQNYKQFLENIAKYNNEEYDHVKNITLTDLRLEELNQILNLTLKHRTDIRYEEPFIFIRGDYISIREITADIEHNLAEGHENLSAALELGVYRFLHIFALKKVFIDHDISFPGLELIVLSPKWEIIGTRIINLDGIDGKPYSEQTVEDGVNAGGNGKDGEPGMPGKPGGNLFGVGESFINGDNLTVTVNGGDGGPGQHGGNGREGERGTDVEYLTDDDLPIRDNEGTFRVKGYLCEKTSDWVDYHKFSSPTENARYKIFASHGQRGGNGGNGGKGGKGGNPGIVSIFSLNRDSNIKICANEGKNGMDGRGGEGGSGGINGQDMIARIRSQPAGIPVVIGAQRMNEWVHQCNISNETRATAGQNGINGANSRGLKVPELSNAISEPSKIINTYKRYAMQHLIYRFKKALLFPFIALLNGSDEIKRIYDIFGFIDEVQVLEGEYLKLSKKLDFVPFYQSVLGRVAEYAKRIESSENSKEHKIVLSYLYTATLSRIYFLRNKRETDLIIDISRYLDMLKKDIEVVKDLQTASNQICLRTKLKEDYKSQIDRRIDEAKYFIRKQILPEFNSISEQIDIKINLLIDETIGLQEKTNNQTQSLSALREELERSLVLKLVFSALKFVANAVSCLGPIGKTVGSVIGTATSAAESLVTKEIETPSVGDSNTMPNFKTIENELKSFQNETLSYFNKLLEEVLKETEEHPDFFQDTRKKIDNIHKQKHNESETNLEYQEIKALEKELNLEFVKKEEMLECQLEDQKSKNSLKAIQKLKNIVQFRSIMLCFQSKSDSAKLEEISNAINRAQEKFKCLKIYEENIYTSIIPMMKTIEDNLYDLERELDSKSRVILDITKWQVQRILKHVQLQIHELTRGFKAESEIVHCVEMLQEVMTILIHIYDQIQLYQEQLTLAEFIAGISSNTTCIISISDPKLANALNELDRAIKSNLVLKQYKTALHAFSQWVFPFSENYIQKSMLPSHLESVKTLDNLVSTAASHIECMKTKVDLYKTSVMKKDKHLHYGEFNSQNFSTKPFFIWKNKEYRNIMSKLLSGQEVLLKADVKKSPAAKQAFKFSCIDFQFRSSSESLQSELIKILKQYDIKATHMGHSYFKFRDKIYLITSDSQTIYYSFEKNVTGECVRSNAVYNKIKNGDLMLSPFAVWKLKLINSTNKGSFVELEKYKNDISLELAGNGSYVTEDDAFRVEDNDYNIIEIYTELDQYLDLIDF